MKQVFLKLGQQLKMTCTQPSACPIGWLKRAKTKTTVAILEVEDEFNSARRSHPGLEAATDLADARLGEALLKTIQNRPDVGDYPNDFENDRPDNLPHMAKR